MTSIEEAREFCSQALPYAIVYEAALAGANFQKLPVQWTLEAPALVFIEISEEGQGHALSMRPSRNGRNAVVATLPNALMVELAQAA